MLHQSTFARLPRLAAMMARQVQQAPRPLLPGVLSASRSPGPQQQQQQQLQQQSRCAPLTALPPCQQQQQHNAAAQPLLLAGRSGPGVRLAAVGGAPQHTRYRGRCAASSSGSGADPQGSSSSLLTLPTMLTLARVAAIPALVYVWFWQHPAASAAATGLFVAASLTDWLDGYLARKLNASSAFGAFLDPVADKLMVAAVLILLSTQPLAAGPLAGNTWLLPVATLVIIGREITMSALREWAATMGPAAQSAVAVNAWGKWKTASQMAALTCLLATKDGAVGQLGALAAAAGPPLLGVAAWLTAQSLAIYFAALWKFMR